MRGVYGRARQGRDGGTGKGREVPSREPSGILDLFFFKFILFIYLLTYFTYFTNFRCQFRSNSADSRPKPASPWATPLALFPPFPGRAISSHVLTPQGSLPLDELKGQLHLVSLFPQLALPFPLLLLIPRVLHPNYRPYV
jgi:hypothetical protein